MKNRRKMIAICVILILLLSSVFATWQSEGLAGVKTVDLLKIFATGMLAGVLITLIKEMVSAKSS